MWQRAIHGAAAVALVWLSFSSVANAAPGDDQYAVAAGHYSQGRWSEAATEFAAFVNQYPQHEKANVSRFYLAEALVQSRRYAEARPYFDKFHAENPDHKFATQALFRRGESAFLSGDSPSGRKHLEAFQQQHPDHALNGYALPYLGEMLLDAGIATQAQAMYAAAVEKFPNGPMVEQSRFGLARSLQMQNKLGEAARHFIEIAQDENSTMADEAWLQLGHVQFQQGQYAECAASMAALTENYPQSRLRAYANYWRGLALKAQDKWAEAATVLETAASVPRNHPLAAAATFHWAEALREAGKPGVAAEVYRGVEFNWPKSAWADDAARGRMRIALAGGEHATVVEFARQFQIKYRSSPLRYDMAIMLGRSHLQQKEYAQAIATLTAAVTALDAIDLTTAEPESVATLPKQSELAELKNSARYYLALSQMSNGQADEALATVKPMQVDETKSPQFAAGVYLIEAGAAMKARDFASAIAPLRGYLRVDPRGVDAAKSHAQLATALAETGQWEAASSALDRYVQQFPNDASRLPTTHYLAEKALAAKQNDLAAKLFRQLTLETNPEQYRAKGLAGLTWLNLDTENPDDGAQALQQLIASHPESPLVPQAALARGQTLEKSRKQDEALAMYELVINKYPTSEQYPHALKHAAAVYEMQGKAAKAQTLLERFVREFPKASDFDGVLYRWAWVLQAQDRDDDAQAVFTRLHLEHPGSKYWADATYRLAEKAAAEGKLERVDALATKIVAASPDDQVAAHALYLQGQTAARSGNWNQVQPPMQKLVDQFPDHPLALSAGYWMGEALYRQGKLDEAKAQFAELSSQTEGRNEPWLAMIDLRHAQILAQQEKWTEAHELAKTIGPKYPNFSQGYEVDYLIGRCLASDAQFAAARTAYERVVNAESARRTETAAKAQWMIGETFFHQKNYDEAIRAYSRVELLYDYPQWQAAALLQAGKCYEEKNDWSQAAQRYDRLIQNFGQTRYKQEATTRLNNAKANAAKQQTTEGATSDASAGSLRR